MRWYREKHNPRHWARWFAWYPVYISGYRDDHGRTYGDATVWLEVVERHATFFGFTNLDDQKWAWDYRYPKEENVVKPSLTDVFLDGP